MAVSKSWTRTTETTASETTAMTFIIADNGTSGAIVHCHADPASSGTPKLLYRIYIDTTIENGVLKPTVHFVSFANAPNYVSAVNPADTAGSVSATREFQPITLSTWHTAAGD